MAIIRNIQFWRGLGFLQCSHFSLLPLLLQKDEPKRNEQILLVSNGIKRGMLNVLGEE